MDGSITRGRSGAVCNDDNDDHNDNDGSVTQKDCFTYWSGLSQERSLPSESLFLVATTNSTCK